MIQRRLAAVRPITAHIPGEGVVQNVGQPVQFNAVRFLQRINANTPTHSHTHIHTQIPASADQTPANQLSLRAA